MNVCEFVCGGRGVWRGVWNVRCALFYISRFAECEAECTTILYILSVNFVEFMYFIETLNFRIWKCQNPSQWQFIQICKKRYLWQVQNFNFICCRGSTLKFALISRETPPEEISPTVSIFSLLKITNQKQSLFYQNYFCNETFGNFYDKIKTINYKLKVRPDVVPIFLQF